MVVCQVVSKDGSPCGAKTFVLWNPPLKPAFLQNRPKGNSAKVNSSRFDNAKVNNAKVNSAKGNIQGGKSGGEHAVGADESVPAARGADKSASLGSSLMGDEMQEWMARWEAAGRGGAASGGKEKETPGKEKAGEENIEMECTGGEKAAKGKAGVAEVVEGGNAKGDAGGGIVILPPSPAGGSASAGDASAGDVPSPGDKPGGTGRGVLGGGRMGGMDQWSAWQAIPDEFTEARLSSIGEVRAP